METSVGSEKWKPLILLALKRPIEANFQESVVVPNSGSVVDLFGGITQLILSVQNLSFLLPATRAPLPHGVQSSNAFLEYLPNVCSHPTPFAAVYCRHSYEISLPSRECTSSLTTTLRDFSPL